MTEKTTVWWIDSKNLLAYLSFYMHKLYEHIDDLQKWNNPRWDEFYFIDEKLWCFIRNLKKIWIDNFEEDIKKLSFDDMKKLHYFNIS